VPIRAVLETGHPPVEVAYEVGCAHLEGDLCMGKGSDPRPVNKKKFDAEFDRVFGTKDVMSFHSLKDSKAEPEDKDEVPRDSEGTSR
jgi:hypothetical protein